MTTGRTQRQARLDRVKTVLELLAALAALAGLGTAGWMFGKTIMPNNEGTVIQQERENEAHVIEGNTDAPTINGDVEGDACLGVNSCQELHDHSTNIQLYNLPIDIRQFDLDVYQYDGADLSTINQTNWLNSGVTLSNRKILGKRVDQPLFLQPLNLSPGNLNSLQFEIDNGGILKLPLVPVVLPPARPGNCNAAPKGSRDWCETPEGQQF